MASNELSTVIKDILNGGEHFISGIHNSSSSPTSLLTAVVQWAGVLKRDLAEIIAVVEPCIRQSILMSLLPAQALDPGFTGSIDVAVEDHLKQLGIDVDTNGKRVLRDICINVRRLRGMSGRAARNATMSLADLRADATLYGQIIARQRGRCLWCGVNLTSANVRETLEHIAPKHLGDDPVDGSNWGIACDSCNNGKSNTLAWATKAEAHDFFGRTDITSTGTITLAHRWAVLMRTRKCIKCNATSKDTELWVYRRVTTGLPIPVNCSVTCEECARKHHFEILQPLWLPAEVGRAIPTP